MEASARHRFRTAKACLRRQVDLAAASEAVERYVKTRPPGSAAVLRLTRRRPDRAWARPASGSARERPEIPADVPHVDTTCLWLEPPSRWRYELEMPSQGVRAVQVVDQQSWWLEDPVNGRRSHETHPTDPGRPRTYPYESFFRASVLMTGLAITEKGHASHLQRSVALFDARPADHAPPELPAGADSYELAVDLQRDVVMRVRAIAAGREFALIEVTEIAFDVEFGPETFRFNSAPSR